MNELHGGVVLYAKDAKLVAQFYGHVANMRVRRTEGDYVLLETGSFQLVVLQIPERLAKTITLESPPVRRESAAIKPILYVENIAESREAASKFGGSLNGAEREWAFDGSIVCDGSDPEGNVYQLRQRQSAERLR